MKGKLDKTGNSIDRNFKNEQNHNWEAGYEQIEKIKRP